MNIDICWEDDKGNIIKQNQMVEVATKTETIIGLVTELSRWFIYLDVEDEIIHINVTSILGITIK